MSKGKKNIVMYFFTGIPIKKNLLKAMSSYLLYLYLQSTNWKNYQDLFKTSLAQPKDRLKNSF